MQKHCAASMACDSMCKNSIIDTDFCSLCQIMDLFSARSGPEKQPVIFTGVKIIVEWL